MIFTAVHPTATLTQHRKIGCSGDCCRRASYRGLFHERRVSNDQTLFFLMAMPHAATPNPNPAKATYGAVFSMKLR